MQFIQYLILCIQYAIYPIFNSKFYSNISVRYVLYVSLLKRTYNPRKWVRQTGTKKPLSSFDIQYMCTVSYIICIVILLFIDSNSSNNYFYKYVITLNWGLDLWSHCYLSLSSHSKIIISCSFFSSWQFLCPSWVLLCPPFPYRSTLPGRCPLGAYTCTVL